MYWIVLFVVLGVSSHPYANKTFYSKNNVYQGKTSSQGNIYNSRNQYQGNIRGNGSIYNKANIYQGQIKSKK